MKILLPLLIKYFMVVIIFLTMMECDKNRRGEQKYDCAIHVLMCFSLSSC